MRRREEIVLTDKERKLVADNLGLAQKEAARVARALASRFDVANHRLRQQFYDEIVGAAYVGLCLAAPRYDPASGCKFSTYASYWVRQQAYEAAQVCELRSGVNRRKRARRIGLFGESGTHDPQAAAGRRDELDPDVSRVLHERLEPRRRRILLDHVLGGRTLADIGRDEGVSRERVRQLVRQAARLAQADWYVVRALRDQAGV